MHFPLYKGREFYQNWRSYLNCAGHGCKRKGILKKKKKDKKNSIIHMLNLPVVYLGISLVVYKVIIPSSFVFYRKCGDAVLVVLLLPIVIKSLKIKLKLFLVSSIKGILSYYQIENSCKQNRYPLSHTRRL